MPEEDGSGRSAGDEPQDFRSSESQGPQRPGFSWLRVALITLIISLAAFITVGGVFVVKGIVGIMTVETAEENRNLSRKEAYGFLQEYSDSVISGAKELFKRYEDHSHLKINSVSVIRDSVEAAPAARTSEYQNAAWITYGYYINGNLDYQVIGASMMSHYQKSDTPGNGYGSWTLGESRNEMAKYSSSLQEAMMVWDNEDRRQYNKELDELGEDLDRVRKEDLDRVERNERMLLELNQEMRQLRDSFDDVALRLRAVDTDAAHKTIDDGVKEVRERIERDLEDASQIREEHRQEFLRRFGALKESYPGIAD